MEYTHLSKDEQAAEIKRRLEGLERDHLNVGLDVEVAGEGGNPAQERRLEQIEQTIDGLRDRLKALEG